MFGINAKELLKGLISYVPGGSKFLGAATGGTDSARYCYAAWFKHLKVALANGLPDAPRVVAEIGPGDTLGCGMAALISGVERYYALEKVDHAKTENNLLVFDELLELFGLQAAVKDWELGVTLEPCRTVLRDDRLDSALKPARLKEIREAVAGLPARNGWIYYVVPWHELHAVPASSIDFLFSHAALEHIDDLEFAFEAMRRWLKPGGVMSHQIDFKCHGLFSGWNGHWACSELVWKLIKGKRPYLINRQPLSAYLDLLEKHGFKRTYLAKTGEPSAVERKNLAKKFSRLSDQDLETSSALIQAVKI